MSFEMPSSRYILPSFVERTSYGMKESNPYNKLFEERIIFLGVQIDDASANDVMAQLITLESNDPDRDITIYINSPGGSVTSPTWRSTPRRSSGCGRRWRRSWRGTPADRSTRSAPTSTATRS